MRAATLFSGIGHRSGNLTAAAMVGRDKWGQAIWLCHCECGNSTRVTQNNLVKRNSVSSCGCAYSESARARVARDGAWNKGKTYHIRDGEHVYRTRHSWSKAALREKGNACECCGWAEARCDVHHRVAKKDGGKNTLNNAVVLCPNCHRIAHERGRLQ